MTTIPSNDSKYASQVPVSLSRAEFEDIRSMSVTSVKYKQLNTVLYRIKQCRNRLQLRFPTVFRDGIILQFLCRYIAENESIRTIACGLQCNYVAGFYALSRLLALDNVQKFNFRINDLSLAPPPFFAALQSSRMQCLQLRFDDVSDCNFERLCSALSASSTLKELMIGSDALSDDAVECLGALCGDGKMERLSIAVQTLSAEQMAVICRGLRRSETISVLDVEDSGLGVEGMKLLTATLRDCGNVRSLSVGNNGDGAIQSLLDDLGALRFVEKLICNESQLVRAEHVELDTVSRSLVEMARFGKLRRVQLPLFITESTTDDALQRFVDALSTGNRIDTLSLFPLLEHLDRGTTNTARRSAAYNRRISSFFEKLFDGLSGSSSLRRLYIELIGSESTFFTHSVAEAFCRFLTASRVVELYVPFCCLVDLKEDILSEGFAKCRHLVSAKDDTTDYHWLDRQRSAASHSATYYSRYTVGTAKRAQMVRAKKYHHFAHGQCQRNMTRHVLQHLPVHDLAVMVAEFCGFEADPEHWML